MDLVRQEKGLAMLARGMSVLEVSEELVVDPSTVRRWRARARSIQEGTVGVSTPTQQGQGQGRESDGTLSLDQILEKIKAVNQDDVEIGSMTLNEMTMALLVAKAANELSLSRSRDIKAKVDAGMMVDRAAVRRLVAQVKIRQERYGLMNRQLWHAVANKSVTDIQKVCEGLQQQLSSTIDSLIRTFEATQGEING